MLHKREVVMHTKCLLAVSHSDMVDPSQEEDKDKGVSHHEQDMSEWALAWDDNTGMALDPKQVRMARLQEIGYIRKKNVWTWITRAEAVQRGIKIVKTRWIDINKGDSDNPVYRSRFVAKEFNDGKDDTLFAATPPLEALRILVSEAATIDPTGSDKVIMTNDVSRAFFEAPMKRE